MKHLKYFAWGLVALCIIGLPMMALWLGFIWCMENVSSDMFLFILFVIGCGIVVYKMGKDFYEQVVKK